MSEKLLSKQQAARFLGISALKLDNLRRDGEVAHIKIGTRVLFSTEDLQGFIERNRHEPTIKDTDQEGKTARKDA